MPESLREMKAKREQAADWITWASWAAMASAVFSGFYLVMWCAGERPPERSEYPLVVASASGAFITGLVGWSLGEKRSQWNAWALMTVYTLGLVLDLLTSAPTNMIYRLGLGVVYVLGFVGTVQYAEMDNAIHQHAASQHNEMPTTHAR